MPSKSEKQRKYIFYLRGKYKSKKNTPKKHQWIWGKEWEKLEESMFDVYLKRAYTEEKSPFKVGDEVIYKNGEKVKIVKIKETSADRDLKGRKLSSTKKGFLYTVEFSDGERQTTDENDFKNKGKK